MADETLLLQLDIGGESTEAQNALQEVSDSLAALQSAVSGVDPTQLQAVGPAGEAAATGAGAAGDAAEGASGGVLDLSSAAEDLFGALTDVLPGLGGFAGLASDAQEALSGLAGGVSEGAGGIAAGLLGLGTVGATAFGLLGGKGIEWADELMRVMAVTGMSQDQAELWDNVLGDVGLSLDSLTGLGYRLQRQLDAQVIAMQQGKDAIGSEVEVLNKLGISFTDAEGNLRPLGELLPEIFEKLGTMDDKNQAVALSTQLFGRQGASLIPIIQNYDTVMASAQRQLHQFEGRHVDATAAAIKYHTRMHDISEQMEVLAVEVLPYFLTALDGLVAGFVKLVDIGKDTIEFFKEHKEALAALAAVGLVAATAGVYALTTAVVALTAALLANPITWIVVAVAALGAGLYLLVTHWNDVTAAVSNFLSMAKGVPILGDILSALETIVRGKIEAIIGLFQGIITIGEEIISFFKDIFSGDFDAALQDLKNIAQTALQVLIDWIKLTFIGDIVTALKSWVPWDAVKDAVADFQVKFAGAFTAVKNFLTDNWPEIATIISGPFAPVVMLATDAFGVRSAFQTAMDNLVQYVSDSIAGIIAFFTNLPGRITELTTDFLNMAATLGNAIRDGLVGGIKGTLGAIGDLESQLWEAIKAIINSAIQAVNDAIPDEIKISIPLAPDVVIDLPDNPIPTLAKGGIVTRPTLGLVGEAGPEAVIPLERGGVGAFYARPIIVNISGSLFEGNEIEARRFARRIGELILQERGVVPAP